MSAVEKHPYKKELGAWGEEYACSYLLQDGAQIIERNARTPFGEIDIVARQNGLYVFIEVKTRSSVLGGYPEEAITTEKIKHMEESIGWYLENHPEIGDRWRVDVISIVGSPKSKTTPILEWWQNEF